MINNSIDSISDNGRLTSTDKSNLPINLIINIEDIYYFIVMESLFNKPSIIEMSLSISKGLCK
jgi:hypothetical protein